MSFYVRQALNDPERLEVFNEAGERIARGHAEVLIIPGAGGRTPILFATDWKAKSLATGPQ